MMEGRKIGEGEGCIEANGGKRRAAAQPQHTERERMGSRGFFSHLFVSLTYGRKYFRSEKFK